MIGVDKVRSTEGVPKFNDRNETESFISMNTLLSILPSIMQHDLSQLNGSQLFHPRRSKRQARK
jgi:hypothetical protein